MRKTLAATLLSLATLGGGCATESAVYDLSPSPAADPDEYFSEGGNRPPSPRTLQALARILIAQMRDTDAQFVLARIIRENPEYAPAYNELAELYLRNDNLGEAVGTLSLGLQTCPGEPVLLNNLGMCQMLQKDYAEALESFTAASGAVPEDARYRGNVAAALGMLGRYEESLNLYRQVVHPADAHHNLGVICTARGDKDQARLEFERAAEIRRNPDVAVTPAGENPL